MKRIDFVILTIIMILTMNACNQKEDIIPTYTGIYQNSNNKTEQRKNRTDGKSEPNSNQSTQTNNNNDHNNPGPDVLTTGLKW